VILWLVCVVGRGGVLLVAVKVLFVIIIRCVITVCILCASVVGGGSGGNVNEFKIVLCFSLFYNYLNYSRAASL